jgi:2-aminoethylphosphonate aminotransferase
MIERKILLNPGPATTSNSVKQAQIVPDICPREKEFGVLMNGVREDLVKIASSSLDKYTCVLFSGSGTAGVEAAISSVVPRKNKILIINNGVYGERMVEIAKIHGISFHELKVKLDEVPRMEEIERILDYDKEIECVAVVHHETTSGILNPIKEIGDIAKRHNCIYIVDAMSSFAGIRFDVEDCGIDFLVSSSNKCIQGMAGLSFVICKKEELEKLGDQRARTHYLNLHKQYEYFKGKGEMRFTPPVQTVYALRAAIDEFFEEGADEREKRYFRNWDVLTMGLREIGFKFLLREGIQSKILTTVVEPENLEFDFEKLHDLLYDKGFTIYPGKIGDRKTFRLANMGAIDHQDIEMFLVALRETLREMGIMKLEYSI